MPAHTLQPKIFGTGLIALDIVISHKSSSPLRAWTGGTCGNVLSILAYLGWLVTPLARLNGDFASQCIAADMVRWGADISFLNCPPTANAPIVIEEIFMNKEALPSHHFIWKCPHCGHSLPYFKPITKAILPIIETSVANCPIFFMDRVSRASLDIASIVKDNGGIIFLNPQVSVIQSYF